MRILLGHILLAYILLGHGLCFTLYIKIVISCSLPFNRPDEIRTLPSLGSFKNRIRRCDLSVLVDYDNVMTSAQILLFVIHKENVNILISLKIFNC